MITAIVGTNWGDEGKGRMVDLLSSEYDIVVRYQGGNNAGHTVVNERGKFILNLLPSGILRETTVNIMGNGMVIDIEHLCREIGTLREKGVTISPQNLKISSRAMVCMPYHKQLDILEENRLGDDQFGSTRRGIAPVYSDKYIKKGIRMGDLLDMNYLKNRLSKIIDWKNLTIHNGYGGEKITAESMIEWLEKFSAPLNGYICDTTIYLNEQIGLGKDILFEAQLGALRDIDFGIYPFTSSSSTLAAYAPIGGGVPACKIDQVIGIMKAYSSCVGEGPFTVELLDENGDYLRSAGDEYGAATGRPRRVGGFDVVASRYGVMVQGATMLALTKLDVLSFAEEIPVCVAYEIDGKITTDFPFGEELNRAKPVYEYFKGFDTDISKCRTKSDLSIPVLSYINYLEKAVGCPIKYVSVGPERDDYIVMY